MREVAEKRVVVFGSYAPSLINFRGDLIRSLVERNHQVFALAPEIGETEAEQLRLLGAEPVRVRLTRASLNPLEAIKTARELRDLFGRISPDLVFAYTATPIVLGARAAASTGARFVPLVTGLGYAFLGGRRPKRLLVRLAAKAAYCRALKVAELVIFQNPDDRQDFRDYGILPAHLPNLVINGSGVNLEYFAKQPLPGDVSFLMIARLLKDKGVREFGEAAARIKNEFPHVGVRLAGWIDNSPDAINDKELRHILSGGVEFLGRMEDVRPALAAASVYVLPSYREGTPRSVLEAMAMGRPIITTDAPGCRETVVHGENGLLIRPRDANAVYEAMRHFVQNPEVIPVMANASRCLAETKYDVREVSGAIIEAVGL